MNKQQVNLYQERFKKKRLWLSAAQLSVCAIAVVFVLGLASFWFERELHDAERFNVSIKQDQLQLSADLEVANAEMSRLLADRSLEQEVEDIRGEITARKRVLRFVDSNQFGSGQGFSESLDALSRLQVSDLWLNEIHLAEGYIGIKGSSLAADLVPMYFNGFKNEDVFSGNRFDIFKLDRPQDSDWKVDFEIATREKVDSP